MEKMFHNANVKIYSSRIFVNACEVASYPQFTKIDLIVGKAQFANINARNMFKKKFAKLNSCKNFFTQGI